MKCHTTPQRLLIFAFTSLVFPVTVCIRQAAADETVSTETVSTETVVTPAQSQTCVSDAGAPIVINTHTGAKYPGCISMRVGQELLFKGNNALDLLTMRYHQVNRYDNQEKAVFEDEQRKGYKASFLAIRPGTTKIEVAGNELFYGLAPWGSKTIDVTVLPSAAESVATKVEIQR